MGLILSECGGRVKTGFLDPGVTIRLGVDSFTLSMNDFCEAALYVLTNTDLEPDDPRIDLVNAVKKLEGAAGYNGARTQRYA